MVGVGVLKGLWVTLREFLGTYPWGRGLLRLGGVSKRSGLVTIQYPDAKQQHPERFRYFPFLVYDNTPDNLRCVACKICEQECPPKCIYIEPARDEQGRPIKAHDRAFPHRFEIDTSICMSCRICVDVCPFEAIEMNNQYELSSHNREASMLMNKEQLLKSNEYFETIHPTEAATVNQLLAAKVKKPAAPAAPSQPTTPPPPAG